MILAQIILTIIAWNRGWKWLSLIPVGGAFLIGLIIGMTFGEYIPFIFVIDILSTIAIIIMAIVKKPINERS